MSYDSDSAHMYVNHARRHLKAGNTEAAADAWQHALTYAGSAGLKVDEFRNSFPDLKKAFHKTDLDNYRKQKNHSLITPEPLTLDSYAPDTLSRIEKPYPVN